MDDRKRKSLNCCYRTFYKENFQYLVKTVGKPILNIGKFICMRMIRFYQKYISRHSCLYYPTCSQYTMECINNNGVIIGIVLGLWRILRCNPFSKGGYDPAPLSFRKRKWLL